MATAARHVYPHITKDPAVCSGSACIAGTRIRVIDVVAAHESGLTPEGIVREYTTLQSPADVYAALLYYHDHKDEIDADLREEELIEEEVERQRSKA